MRESDGKGALAMGQRWLEPFEEENPGVCSRGWGARAPEPVLPTLPHPPLLGSLPRSCDSDSATQAPAKTCFFWGILAHPFAESVSRPGRALPPPPRVTGGGLGMLGGEQGGFEDAGEGEQGGLRMLGGEQREFGDAGGEQGGFGDSGRGNRGGLRMLGVSRGGLGMLEGSREGRWVLVVTAGLRQPRLEGRASPLAPQCTFLGGFCSSQTPLSPQELGWGVGPGWSRSPMSPVPAPARWAARREPCARLGLGLMLIPWLGLFPLVFTSCLTPGGGCGRRGLTLPEGGSLSASPPAACPHPRPQGHGPDTEGWVSWPG